LSGQSDRGPAGTIAIDGTDRRLLLIWVISESGEDFHVTGPYLADPKEDYLVVMMLSIFETRIYDSQAVVARQVRLPNITWLKRIWAM
jgi:hypothetical protein